MIGNALLSFYRSLTRHRLYATLNILGLAVGIAVFLVLFLDVRFEMSWEHWIPDASQIYELRTQWHGVGHPADDRGSTMGATLEELRADYPQLAGVRLLDLGATLQRGREVVPEHVMAVDPTFFKVFDLPLAEGNRATALRAPNSLVLTQAKAKLYFGEADPIGRSIVMSAIGARQIYRVTGVLRDPPRSTDLTLDFIVPLTPMIIASRDNWSHWGSEHLDTFLRFATGGAAQALGADLDNFVDRHAAGDMSPPPAPHRQLSLKLRSLLSLHFVDTKSAPVVAALGVVGVFTLLLAAVNYVNLATARAGLRAREVALRKVTGASPPALFGQFMAESVFTAIVATVIGLALCELALPVVNAAGGLSLKLDYLSWDGPLPAVLTAMIVVGLGAGVYPAAVLAGFRPAQVLASARTPGGGRTGGRVREVLVVFQFGVAIALMAATAVIVSQMRYLRAADVGFQRDGLVVVSSFDDESITHTQQNSLLAAWRATPGVASETAADIAPGNNDSTDANNFKRPGEAGDGPSVNYVWARPGFFETYGARIMAGRALSLDHSGDDAPPPRPQGAPPLRGEARPVRNIVINEGAVRLLGFRGAQDALGKTLLEGVQAGGFARMSVVGVMHDIRLRSPHDPVPATVYFMNSHDFSSEVAVIRYGGVDTHEILARLRHAWISIAPDVPFRAQTSQASLQRYILRDDQQGRLFSIGAGLAVLIGCVGLYGLASFTTARRIKEIGVRKTLGASTADVLRLLVGQFLRPVLIANLIAWPLAYLAMRTWLSGFDQRIALGPQYFLAATALALAIAGLTVVGQALSVARAEPARALRHE